MTPLLLDLLRRDDIATEPFLRWAMARLARPSMRGWQPPMFHGEDGPKGGVPAVLVAIRLQDDRLDVEVEIAEGTLVSEGDDVVATIRSVLPHTVAVAANELTFEKLTSQGALLAGQGKVVVSATPFQAAGLTIISFSASAVAVKLAESDEGDERARLTESAAKDQSEFTPAHRHAHDQSPI